VTAVFAFDTYFTDFLDALGDIITAGPDRSGHAEPNQDCQNSVLAHYLQLSKKPAPLYRSNRQ